MHYAIKDFRHKLVENLWSTGANLEAYLPWSAPVQGQVRLLPRVRRGTGPSSCDVARVPIKID
jgi:hypothetical protein